MGLCESRTVSNNSHHIQVRVNSALEDKSRFVKTHGDNNEEDLALASATPPVVALEAGRSPPRPTSTRQVAPFSPSLPAEQEAGTEAARLSLASPHPPHELNMQELSISGANESKASAAPTATMPAPTPHGAGGAGAGVPATPSQVNTTGGGSSSMSSHFPDMPSKAGRRPVPTINTGSGADDEVLADEVNDTMTPLAPSRSSRFSKLSRSAHVRAHSESAAAIAELAATTPPNRQLSSSARLRGSRGSGAGAGFGAGAGSEFGSGRARITPKHVPAKHTRKVTAVEDEESGVEDVNQYVLTEEIGKGAFARVYKARHKETGEIFAAKVMHKSFLKRKRVGRFGNMLQNVQKEVAVWKKLTHPHIVKLHEVIDDPDHDKLYLISDFISGGSVLPDELDVEPLDHEKCRLYFAQLVDAVDYLHFERIAHRDLKPGNMLVDQNGIIKVADFGVSMMWDDGEDDHIRNTAGTAAFMSPEMTTGDKFSGKCADVWAAGITLYMMFYGKVPFMAKLLPQIYAKIQNDPVDYPDTKYGPLDPDARSILDAMLAKDPLQRPTMDELREHPYVLGACEMTDLPDEVLTVTDEEVESAFTPTLSIQTVVRVRRLSMTLLDKARARIAEKAKAQATPDAASLQQWFFGAAAVKKERTESRLTSSQSSLPLSARQPADSDSDSDSDTSDSDA